MTTTTTEDINSAAFTDAHITPTSDQIISNQPTINIGTIGHVAHGKSTLVKAITSVDTVKFYEEMKRNKMTIRLGYANAKFWKCSNERCPRPGCYASSGSGVSTLICQQCDSEMCLKRHVSFVDCPGHDILMATMLNGAAVMDAALLVVGANKECPQPQTREHLAAVDIMGLRNLIVCQNKIDVVDERSAVNNYREIQKFLRSTATFKDAPVVPISAQQGFNIDVLCEYFVNKIPIPERDLTSPPLMLVVRSFDINKPGMEIDKMKGGVAGGSLTRGTLKVGQQIEIRPGLIYKNDGVIRTTPIRTTVVSLFSEENALELAIPGGLIAVGTNLDPSLTGGDTLVGQVIGIPGHMPEVYSELEINYFLMRRIVGAAADLRVAPLKRGEVLKVSVGSMSTNATVTRVKADLAKLELEIPACTEVGSKIALSRRIDSKWRLISFGIIQKGSKPLINS